MAAGTGHRPHPFLWRLSIVANGMVQGETTRLRALLVCLLVASLPTDALPSSGGVRGPVRDGWRTSSSLRDRSGQSLLLCLLSCVDVPTWTPREARAPPAPAC